MCPPGLRPLIKKEQEVKISRPTRPPTWKSPYFHCNIVVFKKSHPPALTPCDPPRRARPGGRADRARIFEFPLVNFSGLQKADAGFSTLGISRFRINRACGPEQEVSLNKKKKAVNHSCYPDEVIERLARCFYPAILESFNNEEDQKAFAAWQAEQARCSAKEKQDVPTGERPAIHRQLFSSWVRPSGRTLFVFIVKMERIRPTELSVSGHSPREALSERYPDSVFRIKPKIRTLLPQEKGSDFLGLVRVVIQNFSKTIVVQFIFKVIG